MVKEHTKVGLCIFCLMSVSIGLKIASKVLNIKHFSGQLIINLPNNYIEKGLKFQIFFIL